MPEVVVVGDIDVDKFYSVPHLPGWDEGVYVREHYQFPGGKGGNTAAALSRLGTETGIIAAAGDDSYGRIALEGLRKHGVDTRGVTVVPGGETYHCLMLLDPTGEKAILVMPTELIYPTPEMLQEQETYLISAGHAHFLGIDPGRMLKPIQAAAAAGLSVSIDLDAAYQGLEAVRPLLRRVKVVFVNRQGSENLFPGVSDRTAASRLRDLGPEIVVITGGKEGAFGTNAEEEVRVEGEQVEVVDTTGAGDVFSGAFIHAYLRDWDLKKSLEFANAAAALSTTAIGGQSALPSEKEVWTFLENKAAV